ncbi:MAG: hypothetical protein J6K18_01105 [Bacilli bacterium]|nr:hypothetical protein [Bacilli bacterium]
MKKEQLGIKVKGFTGGIITGVVFCLLITLLIFLGFIISGFDIRALILFLMCLGGTIAMFCILVKVLKQPKIILEYDEDNLYFNEYKKITIIPLKEIKEVRAVKEHPYRSSEPFEFGDIIIIKISGLKLVIGKIYDVDKVKEKILQLKDNNLKF